MIHAAVARYYDAALARHGPTARGVDWKDQESHRLRHVQFLRLIAADRDASVFDLGCGYGDFLTVLRGEGHRGRYVGCDVAPGMVQVARALHGEGPDRAWRLSGNPSDACDYAIASGILNVRCGVGAVEWTSYVDGVVAILAQLGRRGFGFNMLTSWSDPERRRPDLHYADPVAVLETCLQRYGRRVALLQDYGLWEFTVLVHHSPITKLAPRQ